jgi:hypothetical protein
MSNILIRDCTGADYPADRMGGPRRPSPVDLRRPVHRRRRSRDRLRRLSGHTGTDRVLGGGTGGFGRGTDGRVRTGTNGQAEPVVVTAGRRGQEIGQPLMERVVSEAVSPGYEYLAIRRPAARNISTIGEFYDAGFRTRPRIRPRHDAQRQLAGGRQALMDETAPRRIGCSGSFGLCRPTARASLPTRRSGLSGADGHPLRADPGYPNGAKAYASQPPSASALLRSWVGQGAPRSRAGQPWPSSGAGRCAGGPGGRSVDTVASSA